MRSPRILLVVAGLLFPFGVARGQEPPAGESTKRSPAMAIESAVEWLVEHQHEDGHWGAASFTDLCDRDGCSGKSLCSGRGNASVDVGVTALALLALLDAGHAGPDGHHREACRSGMRWLVSRQGGEIEGLFGDRSGSYFMYNHALATQTVCHAYAKGLPGLKERAQKALNFIARSRNPYRVWRYQYPPTGRKEDNDMSVTGHMVVALDLGRRAGLTVDAAALESARNFVDEMTDATTGRTGYVQRGGYSSREPGDETRFPNENVETMTAIALWCRDVLGSDGEAVKRGLYLLQNRVPRWEQGHVDFTYWYYGTRAVNVHDGKIAAPWRKAVGRALIDNQVTSGHEAGTWGIDSPWGDIGGRSYMTALGALILIHSSSI